MLEANAERNYQDLSFANRYLGAYEGPVSLKTLAARIIAKREQACVRAAFSALDPPPAVVLDCPCGTGKLGQLLTAFWVRTTASDLSEAMMAHARLKYRPDTEFISANAEALPFADQSFDTAICLRLMHLIPPTSRRAVLKELARVSSRHVIASFGVLTPFQSLRLRLRRALFKGKSTPYPVRLEVLQSELAGVGLRMVRQQSILPGLSCERLLTLEKL